jgi:hypothetical protein
MIHHYCVLTRSFVSTVGDARSIDKRLHSETGSVDGPHGFPSSVAAMFWFTPSFTLFDD